MGPMGSNGGRYGPRWERVRARVIREETHCGLCGKPVDKALPDRDPVTGKQDPMAKTVDHITPLAFGGGMYDRANLQLAHRRCQHIQGGRTTKELYRRGVLTAKRSRRKGKKRKRRTTTPRPLVVVDHGHSREW